MTLSARAFKAKRQKLCRPSTSSQKFQLQIYSCVAHRRPRKNFLKRSQLSILMLRSTIYGPFLSKMFLLRVSTRTLDIQTKIFLLFLVFPPVLPCRCRNTTINSVTSGFLHVFPSLIFPQELTVHHYKIIIEYQINKHSLYGSQTSVCSVVARLQGWMTDKRLFDPQGSDFFFSTQGPDRVWKTLSLALRLVQLALYSNLGRLGSEFNITSIYCQNQYG